MKLTFALYLFVILIRFGYSQDFVLGEKQWSNIIVYSPTFMEMSTEVYMLDDDTIIESMSYRKILRCTDEFLIDWTCFGYIRETVDNKVYFRSDTSLQDYLVYDFGIETGDTITIYAFSGYSAWTLYPMTFYVCDTESLPISGELRKHFYLSPMFDGDTLGCYCEKWANGIGSFSGFLHITDGTVGGHFTELLCFSENDTLKYMADNYSSCFIDNTISPELTNNILIEVSPNPVIDILKIGVISQNQNQFIIEIYNQNTSIILTKEFIGKASIDLSSLNKGLYYYRIIDDKECVQKGKLIKL